MQSKIKQTITPFILNTQKYFKLFPSEMCLITGAPRSGTSALGKWLGTQPSVAVFPESRILLSINSFIKEAFRFKNLERDKTKIAKLAQHLVYDYYLDSRVLLGKKLIVQKEPLEPIAFPSKNYKQFILNIKDLLPNIKIIFLIRDPIATIWSMSSRTWGESLTTPKEHRFSLEEYAENWSACVETALHFSTDSNTYLLQFGRLVNDPENESKRVFDFLNIHNGTPFQPRQTKEIGFSKKEKEKILTSVQPQLDKLKLHGITNLQDEKPRTLHDHDLRTKI